MNERLDKKIISSLLHYLFLTREFYRKRKQTSCKDQNLEMFTSFFHLEVVDTPHTIFSRYNSGYFHAFTMQFPYGLFILDRRGISKQIIWTFFHSSEWM